jgi:phenylacetate-coenzyme A ligase PaaK-like adenylate-forming protein
MSTKSAERIWKATEKMVDSLVENSPHTAKIFYQTTAKPSEYRKNPEIKALPTTEKTVLILSPSRLPIPSRQLTGLVYHISDFLSIPAS